MKFLVGRHQQRDMLKELWTTYGSRSVTCPKTIDVLGTDSETFVSLLRHPFRIRFVLCGAPLYDPPDVGLLVGV
jgi:hypothetical protein